MVRGLSRFAMYGNLLCPATHRHNNNTILQQKYYWVFYQWSKNRVFKSHRGTEKSEIFLTFTLTTSDVQMYQAPSTCPALYYWVYQTVIDRHKLRTVCIYYSCSTLEYSTLCIKSPDELGDWGNASRLKLRICILVDMWTCDRYPRSAPEKWGCPFRGDHPAFRKG